MADPKFCGYCGRGLVLVPSEVSEYLFLRCPTLVGWRLWFNGDWRIHTMEITNIKAASKDRYDRMTGERRA